MSFRIVVLIISLLQFGCLYNAIEYPAECSASDIVAQVTTSDATCGLADGSIELVVTGGSPPYSFRLDGGAVQNSAFFTDLAAGSYTVTVFDNLGCSIDVSASVINTGGFSATIQVENADCESSNGKIIVTAENGIGPYQYQLGSNNPQSNPEFVVGQGSYQVYTIDANGCTYSTQVNVSSNTSYASDVQPIIMNSCSVIGCHDGSRPARANFTNFSEVQANASMIKSRTQSGNMPRNGSLTAQQIAIIACWVDDGAKDN